MESESVALKDNLRLVEFFHEFLEFVTGGNISTPVVDKDYNVVVSLVIKGGGKTRTKHLRVWMNLGKEMVDEWRIKVFYIKVSDMGTDLAIHTFCSRENSLRSG